MATDLVVILSSDWVDSTATRTRLGEEPADTLQELHDSLLRKVIGAEGGEVIKHSGDGVLATFRSATAALAAAVNIQKEFARYTASPGAIAPIRVRVGLAAGDVKPMSGDIFGRPVVEAVRLQSLAAPDGVLCSELVRVLTYGRGGFEFEDLGLRERKGLAPVQAHRVTRASTSGEGTADADAQLGATRQRAVGSAEAVRGHRSPDTAIAVLPFMNMSPDPDQDYFSDGLSEELINQLAQIETLRVPGRTSSFAFKNKAADFADIGATYSCAAPRRLRCDSLASALSRCGSSRPSRSSRRSSASSGIGVRPGSGATSRARSATTTSSACDANACSESRRRNSKVERQEKNK
jgi:adenylate cyclase